MKKNLTVIAIALVALVMAIPASAASLSLKGEYSAAFTFDYAAAGETWTPDKLGEAADHKLKLNLTFTEGESIVAYLPLTMTKFGATPSLAIGSWYFSYNTAPWAFWVSKNDAYNAKKFASLGDPLGIVAAAKLDGATATNWALNAKGDILGAGLNLYALDYAGQAGWVGRATYPLPMDFKVGLVGAYTSRPAEDDLTFGADVVGKVPGLDATLTLAGAGYWTKTGAMKFEGPVDNVAVLAKVADLKLGPVTAWASYTGVGANFVSHYKATAGGAILNKYAGSAAAELGVTAALPVGIPTTLTLGDTLWMGYPTNPKWNETTGKVVVTPMENLDVTVSGAYKADLDDKDAKDYKGYKAHADVKYTAFGLELKPFADYKVDSYADPTVHTGNKVVDTIVGLNVDGSPLAGLNLGVRASYTVEEPKTALKGWGIYATELNPGFVKSAMTKIAGVAEYNKKATDAATTDFYGYAGSDIVVTDKLSAKVGVLTKDEKKEIAAHAGLAYQVSDSIATGLSYTYRGFAVAPDADHAGMWKPFDDKNKSFVEANVTGKVGASTIKLAYGVSGLGPTCDDLECDGDTEFHVGKPWAWLYHHPETFMNWQLVKLSVKVPF